MGSAPRTDEGGGRGPVATVFVCDPTIESERSAQALRSASYVVVDVPLSMLVARIAVQRPRVVVIDADNEGALDVVTRIRELADADAIHVLFVARPGGAIATPNEALAHEGSGLFVRPVDVAELVRTVKLLTMSPSDPDLAARTSALPPPLSSPPSVPVPPPTSSVPPLVPPLGPPGIAVAPPPADPPLERTDPPARMALGFAHAVSPELQQLLADAEERVARSEDPEPPVLSPEEEIEAVVPAEWLTALDELLEDEAEDDSTVGRSQIPPAVRDRSAASSPALTDNGLSTPLPAQVHGPTESGSTNASSRGQPSERAEVPAGILHDHVRDAEDRRFPSVLGPGDAMRVLARAIAWRTTGSLCLVTSNAERRVILREGDVVTASSSVEDESLLAFLVQRGDLPRETMRRVGPEFPAFGRHSAAALVARGYLRQDQMWEALRAHAEWLLARVLPLPQARFILEAPPPGRLASEPSVFGASPGAEVFVEVIRRIVAPVEALNRMGGSESRVTDGPAARLLDECGLTPPELERLRESAGRPWSEVLDQGPDGDLATAVFALWQLGVIEMVRSVADRPARDGESAADKRAVDVAALDADALRERVQARMQLVEDGDYFSLLGVARDATGYEIRRAFLELRRTLEPSRVLTPEVADLDEDLRKIILVLEEAYAVLKDAASRERYRRAIES